jgi:hypothetical protein
MALFVECMQECARKVLDTADIVRDGDITSTMAGTFLADSRVRNAAGKGRAFMLQAQQSP